MTWEECCMDVPVGLCGDQDCCWLHGSGAVTRAAGDAHQEPGVQTKAIYRKPTLCLLAVRQAFVSADNLSPSQASN